MKSLPSLLRKKSPLLSPRPTPLFEIEELEDRIVPTTLNPGDVFSFTDSKSNTITVTFDSDAAAASVTLDDNDGLGPNNDDGVIDNLEDIHSIAFDADNDSTSVLTIVSDPDTLHVVYNDGTTDFTAPAGSGGVFIAGDITAITDIGTILIDGTVGDYLHDGTISIDGNIGVLQVGFLAGSINITGSVTGDLTIVTDAGFLFTGTDATDPRDVLYHFADSEISVAGNVDLFSVGGVSVGGGLGSDVNIGGNVDTFLVRGTLGGSTGFGTLGQIDIDTTVHVGGDVNSIMQIQFLAGSLNIDGSVNDLRIVENAGFVTGADAGNPSATAGDPIAVAYRYSDSEIHVGGDVGDFSVGHYPVPGTPAIAEQISALGSDVWIEGSLGRMLVTGILGGASPSLFDYDTLVTVDGDLGFLQAGFLGGSIEVGGYANVVNIIGNAGYHEWADGSHVFGNSEMTFLENLGTVYVGGILTSEILVFGDPYAYDIIYGELEDWGYFPSPFTSPLEEAFNLLDNSAVPEFISSPTGNITLVGTLQGPVNRDDDPAIGDDEWDTLDRYAFNLLAGTTFTATYFGELAVGLFDPAGVLVATTASDFVHSPGLISFMPEENGVYQMVVGFFDDWNFSGDQWWATVGYSIDITATAPVVLGGIEVGGYIYASYVQAFGGDIGDISTAGVTRLFEAYADAGSIQSIRAFDIGGDSAFDGILYSYNIFQASNDIGLISATNILWADFVAGDNIEQVNVTSDLLGYTFGTPLSGVNAKFIANGSIGSVRVGGDATFAQFFVDADHTGTPEFFDLLSVGGNLDRSVIYTSAGSNVRFVEVGGSIIWRDPITFWTSVLGPFDFGTGTPSSYRTVTDDSGGILTLSPSGDLPEVDEFGHIVVDGLGNPVIALAFDYSYRILPIMGWNPAASNYFVIGNAITDINATGPLSIRTQNDVEIGKITMDVDTGALETLREQLQDLKDLGIHVPYEVPFADLSMHASSPGRIDVYHITSLQDINNITNSTVGDLLAVEIVGGANTIRTGGNIGFTYNIAGGVRVTGPVPETELPFPVYVNLDGEGHLNGVLADTVREVRANGAIANVITLGENAEVEVPNLATSDPDDTITVIVSPLGRVIANADGVTTSPIFGHGLFDGIAGAIVSAGGNIDRVDVGDGLADEGSGFYAQAGIFAAGAITSGVFASGPFHDIVGPIIAVGINKVQVSDGAYIIDSLIESGSVFADFQAWNGSYSSSGEITNILASGFGSGIASSLIYASTIGNIRTTSGADGIFNCDIAAFAQGGIGTISAVGDGIWSTYIFSAGGIKTIEAKLGDIAYSNISALTIDNVKAADDIVSTDMLGTLRIGKITVGDEFISSSVSGGNIESILVGNNINELYVTVAGPLGLGSVVCENGPILGYFYALGPSGHIGTISAYGDLSGIIYSYGSIGTVESVTGAINADVITTGPNAGVGAYIVGTDVTGDIILTGGLGLLRLNNGSLFGNVDIDGPLGSVLVYSGDITGNIEASSIGKIDVRGGDISGPGGLGTFNSIEATLGDIGSIRVRAINGVGGSLSSNILAAGLVKSVQVMGDFDGSLEGMSLGKISVRGGDLLASLEANAGGIGRIEVRGSDIFGDITATGLVGSIRADRVINSDVEAGSIKSITGGSISDSHFRSAGVISSIKVTGPVTNSVFSASGISKVSIGGNLTGSALLAGLDIGSDMAIGGGDDVLSSGSIGSVSVKGSMRASTIAAGVGPGVDTMFGNGNDVGAGGLGIIKAIKVAGVIDDGGTGNFFGILADSGTFKVSYASGSFVIGGAGQYLDSPTNHVLAQVI